ncbi:MAG: maleylpyruvate isomerase family mycothiol-dependent enzyme [Nocardioidaceae bacterium]
MPLSTEQCLAAIAEHSAGFAAATRDHLTGQVQHCPDWDVADLVAHRTDVQWFWATIAERLPEEPPQEGRPERAPDEQLVETFERGAERLVAVLGAADQGAACWTWAPQRDVAFITRHQVQEAAVHHWDAANAAGAPWTIDPLVAADCVEEFLTFSVSSDADPASEPRPGLDGSFAVVATDAGASWTVSDGKNPDTGTLAVSAGAADGLPAVEATAGDLLLWLYGRKDIDTSPVPAVLVERFRGLLFTD